MIDLARAVNITRHLISCVNNTVMQILHSRFAYTKTPRKCSLRKIHVGLFRHVNGADLFFFNKHISLPSSSRSSFSSMPSAIPGTCEHTTDKGENQSRSGWRGLSSRFCPDSCHGTGNTVGSGTVQGTTTTTGSDFASQSTASVVRPVSYDRNLPPTRSVVLVQTRFFV